MLPVILLAFLPTVLGDFSQCGGLSPGEMAHRLFIEADYNHNGQLSLGEVLFLFEAFDESGDGSITRSEYLRYIQDTEPQMEPWYDRLFDTFDMDSDHRLDLHDYVHFYLKLDPEHENHVTEAAFIGYWSVLYTTLLEHQHETC